MVARNLLLPDNEAALPALPNRRKQHPFSPIAGSVFQGILINFSPHLPYATNDIEVYSNTLVFLQRIK